VNALVVSPAGDRFALVSDGPEIKLFDFAGKELATYAMPGTVNAAAFSADGRTLAAANADGSIGVIDLP
jgi:WD40 repeat protein